MFAQPHTKWLMRFRVLPNYCENIVNALIVVAGVRNVVDLNLCKFLASSVAIAVVRTHLFRRRLCHSWHIRHGVYPRSFPCNYAPNYCLIYYSSTQWFRPFDASHFSSFIMSFLLPICQPVTVDGVPPSTLRPPQLPWVSWTSYCYGNNVACALPHRPKDLWEDISARENKFPNIPPFGCNCRRWFTLLIAAWETKSKVKKEGTSLLR